MSDPELRRQIQRLADELARTQSEVRTLRRGQRRPQLGHSSIESGSLDVVDPDTGEVRQRIGYQPDGTVGVVVEGGDPPPAPSTPVVAAAPMGLMVQWDGALADPELALPSDFDHVSVHVSAASGFTPTAATFQGTIPRAGGLFPVVPLEVGATYYVVLVPVGTGGTEGTLSAQASGIPEGVGGVPEPGSITETEIADDAITTPKIRALAVQAYHIVAAAIEAGHIVAGAVEASKLAATIVLSTSIVAGDPMAARVILDEHGLRGYNTDNEVVFAVDDSGNAVFTGQIFGSEISGSRISLAGTGGTTGAIEAVGSTVRARIDSTSGARAQLASSTGQAEFSVWGDTADPNGPAGGVLAQPGLAALTLYSDVGNPTTTPTMQLSALPGAAQGLWRSDVGSEVRVYAGDGWSAVFALPPASTVGQPAASAGYVYAFRRADSDAPTLSLQSPVSTSGPGANRRSIIHVEGANTNRAHTIINHAARIHYLQGEIVDGSTDTTTDGRVELAGTHSILASRHNTEVGQFNDIVPTVTTNGAFVDFTTAQWDRVAVKTGASGRVAVVIRVFGYSAQTTGSSLAIGWRTSNNAIEAHLDRSFYFVCGSTSYSQMLPVTEITTFATLSPNTTYTFIPAWRKSSGTWGSNVHMSNRLHGTAMLVTPLM